MEYLIKAQRIAGADAIFACLPLLCRLAVTGVVTYRFDSSLLHERTSQALQENISSARIDCSHHGRGCEI
jgi:hypothetical protein